jgi:hypothetical protein
MLRLCDKRSVSEAAEKVDHLLLKNKTNQQPVNDAEEKAKLLFELALVARAKFEEDERKKRVEEEDDSKNDYLTLFINPTKKHGLMRKGMPGTGASLPFKHSNTRIKGLMGPGLTKP